MGGGPNSPKSTSEDPLALSTLSTDSMVQIASFHEREQASQAQDSEQYRLLYSKSKVYVHPTAYSRDNIPGFVALVKQDVINPKYLLAWIPESLLNEKGPTEWEKFVRAESTSPGASSSEEDQDGVLVNLPSPHGYAFSVSLSSVYSLIVQPPTLSSWYGSISINLYSGTTLSTLYFHDDESKGIVHMSGLRPSPPPPTWGGEELLQRLRSYSNILRSTLDPSLFLVDPSKVDIEAHTIPMFSDEAVDMIMANSATSSSPIPIHRRPPRPRSAPGTPSGDAEGRYPPGQSLLHDSLPPSPRSLGAFPGPSLLQTFSNITRGARHAAQQILSHPLAKPIIPHLPEPVKSLVNVEGEWASWVEQGGVGEFESARVYLARWARIVAEEGERARQREAHAIHNGSEDDERTGLGVFELIHATSNLPTPKTTREPKQPINKASWDQWFESDGSPKITSTEMRREIFRRGLEFDVRREAWPLLLDVLPWDATMQQRQKVWEEKKETYIKVKSEWSGVDEVFNRSDVIEERHRIDVDCRRTDRTQPLFAMPDGSSTAPTRSRDAITVAKEEIGSQAASNEHVDTLATILLTYNFYEKDLGYVQGMSDLCAPIYVICGGDEASTFWCFVKVMEKMKQNFLRDQSGMKKQLLTLQQLIAVMDPELYKHFQKADALNLFFCFRWVLIAFKREFEFEDVLRLWEVLWTDYYSNQFALFVALAVLESHRDVILRYLVEFDEILKYCNELSMSIELDSTLSQAEVLFLSFCQIVADMDRRRVEAEDSQPEGLRRRGRTDYSVEDLRLSDNLRELMQSE